MRVLDHPSITNIVEILVERSGNNFSVDAALAEVDVALRTFTNMQLEIADNEISFLNERQLETVLANPNNFAMGPATYEVISIILWHLKV